MEYFCWQPSWPALGTQFFKLLHNISLNYYQKKKKKSLNSSQYLINTLENGQSSLLETKPMRSTALQQPAQVKCLNGLCFEVWGCPNEVLSLAWLWMLLFPSICIHFNFSYVTFIWENKKPPQHWEFFQCYISLLSS